MTKNPQRKQSCQAFQDKEYRITNEMPAWMRQILACEGIDREFKIHELTPDQRHIIDFACHLEEMQKHGLIEIIFDPKTNQQPLIAPTERGLKEYT